LRPNLNPYGGIILNIPFFYLFKESLRGWKQHRLVIIPSVITIFLCGFVLSASLIALNLSWSLSRGGLQQYMAEAFLAPGTPDPVLVRDMEILLNDLKETDSVLFISQAEALQIFKTSFGEDMLDLVEGNPFPASFRVYLRQGYANGAELRKLVGLLARIEGIQDVSSSLSLIEWYEQHKFDFFFWPLFICVVLLITLWMVIGNAVRLSLFSRKNLVENMKYGGGSELFIELPFVLEGMLQGLIGGGLASIIWVSMIWYLGVTYPVIEPALQGVLLPLSLQVVGVVLIGGYTSHLSVRRFLRGEN
jgi:cell division transport system permease protein